MSDVTPHDKTEESTYVILKTLNSGVEVFRKFAARQVDLQVGILREVADSLQPCDVASANELKKAATSLNDLVCFLDASAVMDVLFQLSRTETLAWNDVCESRQLGLYFLNDLYCLILGEYSAIRGIAGKRSLVRAGAIEFIPGRPDSLRLMSSEDRGAVGQVLKLVDTLRNLEPRSPP
jgi:hypothetical protein